MLGRSLHLTLAQLFSTCKTELMCWRLPNLVLHWPWVKGIVLKKKKKAKVETGRRAKSLMPSAALPPYIAHPPEEEGVWNLPLTQTLPARTAVQCCLGSPEQLDHGAVKTCQ